MDATATTLTLTPSISAVPPKPEAEPKGVSTSDLTASAMPSVELLDLLTAAWREKAPLCVLVAGSETTALQTKNGKGKRSQSLPPGDVLVIVLPAKTRKPGVYLIEPPASTATEI